MIKVTDTEMIRTAKEIIANAYAPYSGIRVGAALEADDGSVFAGVNIENSSYGLSICAERVALFRAVSEGHRHFDRLVIAVDIAEPIKPCGACLQVLSEFGSNIRLIMVAQGETEERKTLSELLPVPFDLGK